jgi:hypothetical protein
MARGGSRIVHIARRDVCRPPCVFAVNKALQAPPDGPEP